MQKAHCTVRALGTNMRYDSIAEIILTEVSGGPSPPASFGFIMTFENESFSAAIIDPLESIDIIIGRPQKIHLKFLFPENALKVAKVGARFNFIDQGRKGNGQIIKVVPSTAQGTQIPRPMSGSVKLKLI